MRQSKRITPTANERSPDRRFSSRVAFIAHALLPGYLSTSLISERLNELGRVWPKPDENPSYIRWFDFPVFPRPDSDGQPVWVDFYIIPVLAPAFLKAIANDRAFDWVERTALDALTEAKRDGVELTIGWGALTKIATNHGERFIASHPDLVGSVSTTHGDAGTSQLLIETLGLAGITDGARIAIIGANGAIGEAVSRALGQLSPESILLVGKGDKSGEKKNLDRLTALKGEVERAGMSGEVLVHQNKAVACHDHKSDVVIVATWGMDLKPEEIPAGALVLDTTTPAACKSNSGWADKLVLTAGCGEFDRSIIRKGFGAINGQTLWDVGAGGPRDIWGCTGEAIAWAVFGRRTHVTGQRIPKAELEWCQHHFPLLGFHSQPPVSFGKLLEWEDVRVFVRHQAVRRSRHHSTGGAIRSSHL